MSNPRNRIGCLTCRERHVKCDDQHPICSRCSKSGLDCIRTFEVKFKHGANPSVKTKASGLRKCEYDFADNQTWCKTPHFLNFIDETHALVTTYERDSDGLEDASTEIVTSVSVAREESEADVSPVTTALPISRSNSLEIVGDAKQSPFQKRKRLNSPLHSYHGSFSGSLDQSRSLLNDSPQSVRNQWSESSFAIPSASSITPTSFSAAYSTNAPEEHYPLEPTISHQESVDTGTSPVSRNLARLYRDNLFWPLHTTDEAKLMRYFIEKLSISFDLCDPDRHFALIVPQRAANCPILLNAIFAASARHLSKVSNFDQYVSDRYYQECLTHLIPKLSDNAAVMDENLLAATVILRYLEEVDVSISGLDFQSHLLGTHVFISAQESSTIMGGLRRAAFWVALRQEIYIAFVNQRSILPALSHCNIDRSFEPASDFIWANRIIVLCADVIRYCYAEAPPTTPSSNAGSLDYITLLNYCDEWITRKPIGFDPLYYHEPDPETIEEVEHESIGKGVFPEIWLLGDAIVTGLQHYYLARILLAAHDPRLPRLGPASRVAARRVDEEVRDYVKKICGMAVSNPNTPPHFISASMAIACAGDRFTERREQEALMEVLTETDKVYAWPSGTFQSHLREAWGWDDS